MIRRARRSSGFLLVEALVLVAGVSLLATAYFAHVTSEEIAQAKRYAKSDAERASDAVRAFAYLNGRLPRPATGGGNEGPPGTRSGRVPVAAMGLALPVGVDIVYNLPNAALTLSGAHDATVIAPVGSDKSMRFEERPLRSTGVNVGSPGYAQHSFCEGLRAFGSTGTELYSVGAAAQSGGDRQQVAVSTAAIWVEMGCAAQRETLLRSHRNLLAQSHYMLRSYQDWNELKKIEEILYAADVIGGTGWLAEAFNGVAREGAKLLGNAAADTCALCPDAPGVSTAFAHGLSPLNAAKVARAAVNLSRFVAMQTVYGQDLVEFDRVEDEMRNLVRDMDRRVTELTDHGRAHTHR